MLRVRGPTRPSQQESGWFEGIFPTVAHLAYPRSLYLRVTRRVRSAQTLLMIGRTQVDEQVRWHEHQPT